MASKEHLSKGEEVERAAEIRAKKERGEKLTHHEAGVLGGTERAGEARE